MDTKSKKWKLVLSFLTFWLGLFAIMGGIGVSLIILSLHRPSVIPDVFQGDFLQTSVFRESVTNTLNMLLYEAESAPANQPALVDDTSQNLVYRVNRDGKPLLVSKSALGQTPSPDRYSFVLTFDGETVSITLDGFALDIYGDGYYRENSGSWSVPGYLNYSAPEEHRNLDVTLWAVREPVHYQTDGQYDNLYTAVDYTGQIRVAILLLTVLPLGLALLCLVLAFLWRRARQEAYRAIAQVTGRIWLEFKLLLVPLWLVGCWLLSALIAYFVQFSFLPAIPFTLFVLCLYLNDLRHNGLHVFRHSGCAALARLLGTRDMKYPAQVRIAKRVKSMFYLALPMVVFSGLWGLSTLYSSLSRRWISFGLPLVLLGFVWLALVAGQILLLRRNKQTTDDLGVLLTRIGAIHSGDLSAAPAFLPDSDLYAAAHQLEDLQGGLQTALEERTRSDRMKVELIANVSHDLKTPLTSIISYAELLGREEELPDHVRDYIKILNDKSQRLKTMVQEVFEVSKATSGNLPVHLEALDLAKLLRQTMADMEEPIANSALTFRVQLPECTYIVADGDRLYRVFQNLIQNALHYALDSSRVFLTLKTADNTATVTLQNTSRDELAEHLDLTARFVRGDESRTDGGSGLGLSIARSFTEACGGTFRVEAVADLFTATVVFPLTARRPEALAATD